MESRRKNPTVEKLWRQKNPTRAQEIAARSRKKYPRRMAEWRVKNRRRSNDTERISRLRKAGARISKELLLALQAGQNNRCAICGKPESLRHGTNKTKAALSIDHDHVTGQVRGLLCRRCNSGIAYLDEDPKVLLRAASYLLKAKLCE